MTLDLPHLSLEQKGGKRARTLGYCWLVRLYSTLTLSFTAPSSRGLRGISTDFGGRGRSVLVGLVVSVTNRVEVESWEDGRTPSW